MISNEEMVDSLQKLVAIKSISGKAAAHKPFGEGPSEALDYVLSLCSSLGFRTKNCSDYLGYAEIGEGKDLFGILVHLDVVPAGSGWDYDPFTVTVSDGKLYGRGVTDDKGPAIACIYALKDLLDEGIKWNRRVRILFGLSEETGDWPDMEYYKKTEELPRCGFTPDADFPAIYGEKGIAMFRLSMPLVQSGIRELSGGVAPNMVADFCKATLTGKNGESISLTASGRAAHGSTPEDGENAISKLMADIHMHENTADCSFAQFYHETIGFDLHGERLGCQLSDPQSGALTLNVGLAGTTADTAYLTIDVRYPVTFTLEEVQRRIQETCKKYGVTVSVESHKKPVYMEKDGELISSLMDAYQIMTGDKTAQPTVMGGGTYARAMDGIVAFGPMLPGRECTEHQKNEYLFVEDFYQLREIYRLAVRQICEAV